MTAELAFLRGLGNIKPAYHHCVATIGNFDGVHLGHQYILKNLKQAAQTANKPAVVIIFEPHPQMYFHSASHGMRLMSLREKVHAIAKHGIDGVLCLRFNAPLAALSPEAFIDSVLVNGLHVDRIIVGDDFRFGCNRAGDFALLKRIGQQHGFEVDRLVTFEQMHQRVSSTLIRQTLMQGNCEQAAMLLGKPFQVSGRVQYGQQRGRAIGFPTANIKVNVARDVLAHGVYAVQVVVSEGLTFPAIANIGMRPTIVHDDGVVLEVHIFDFDQLIYGRRIKVNFLNKIRNEQRFDSVMALKQQIAIDAQKARDFFSVFSNT